MKRARSSCNRRDSGLPAMYDASASANRSTSLVVASTSRSYNWGCRADRLTCAAEATSFPLLRDRRDGVVGGGAPVPEIQLNGADDHRPGGHLRPAGAGRHSPWQARRVRRQPAVGVRTTTGISRVVFIWYAS